MSILYAIQEEDLHKKNASSSIDINNNNNNNNNNKTPVVNNIYKPFLPPPVVQLTSIQKFNTILLKIFLKMSTIILAILTFLFALLMAPYAMNVGRSKSITELKHEIQSLWYRAPEVMFCINYDYCIDLWSFGWKKTNCIYK